MAATLHKEQQQVEEGNVDIVVVQQRYYISRELRGQQ
jgi:hypothetical protein